MFSNYAKRYGPHLRAVQRYAYLMYGGKIHGDSAILEGLRVLTRGQFTDPGGLSDFGVIVKCMNVAKSKQSSRSKPGPTNEHPLLHELGELSEPVRAAFLLTMVQELSDEETAIILDQNCESVNAAVEDAMILIG